MRFPFIYFLTWVFTRVVSRLVFRMKVVGVEHVPPSAGFILAGNHRSYYDPVLILTWLWRPGYSFAKAELFHNPILAYILNHCLAFPVRRGVVDRQALAKATEVIREGKMLVMFPEGTRCRTGDFLPAKPGIGLVAIAAGCQIVPTYLHGFDKLWDCLLGRDRLSIRYGKPIEVSGFTDEKSSYVAIAQQVMAQIRAMSEDVAAEK